MVDEDVDGTPDTGNAVEGMKDDGVGCSVVGSDVGVLVEYVEGIAVVGVDVDLVGIRNGGALGSTVD